MKAERSLREKKIFRRAGAVLAVLLAAVCFFSACGEIDWDKEVNEYLKQYKVPLSVGKAGEDGGKRLYPVVTEDERKIAFTVTCVYGNKTSPLGGDEPWKSKNIYDDFYKCLQDYFSETRGVVDITDMTLKESTDYLNGVFDEAEEAAKAYGIQTALRPEIHFKVTNGDVTKEFTAGPAGNPDFDSFLKEQLGKKE